MISSFTDADVVGSPLAFLELAGNRALLAARSRSLGSDPAYRRDDADADADADAGADADADADAPETRTRSPHGEWAADGDADATPSN